MFYFLVLVVWVLLGLGLGHVFRKAIQCMRRQS